MSIYDKINFLFPENESKRIQMSETKANGLSIMFDAHGLKCWQAERAINNLINIVQRPFTLTIVHGYNHGTAILKMVREKLTNPHILQRQTDTYNQGVTYLAIA